MIEWVKVTEAKDVQLKNQQTSIKEIELGKVIEVRAVHLEKQ
jgi:hypothetical protein